MLDFFVLLLIQIFNVGAYQACLSVMFYHICAFCHLCGVLVKFTAADITTALVSSRLDYTTRFFTAYSWGAWHVCSVLKIQLQGFYYSSHH